MGYMKERNRRVDGHQEELLFMKKKIMLSILCMKDHFLIVCCKDYDKDLDVYSTKWQTKERFYKLSIDRRIEPDCIRVFDTYYQ